MINQTFSEVQVPLTFKAKELFMIAYYLKSVEASTMFPLVYKIKMAISDETQPEDNVQVQATIEQVIYVLSLLGAQPEAIMANINKSIKLSLISQLEVLANATDEAISGAALRIAELEGSITLNNEQTANFRINGGKNFLLKV